jgi:hypothetical protein
LPPRLFQPSNRSPTGLATGPRRDRPTVESGAAAGSLRVLCWRSSTVEHLFCKQAVAGSNPVVSYLYHSHASVCRSRAPSAPRATPSPGGLTDFRENAKKYGELPERPKGADCKSAGSRLQWFESTTLHLPEVPPTVVGLRRRYRGRARNAGVAQLVERQPSKLNVVGSNPISRSSIVPTKPMDSDPSSDSVPKYAQVAQW